MITAKAKARILMMIYFREKTLQSLFFSGPDHSMVLGNQNAYQAALRDVLSEVGLR